MRQGPDAAEGGARARIRVAAEATASPRLRIALEATTDDAIEATRALEAFEDEAAPRVERAKAQ